MRHPQWPKTHLDKAVSVIRESQTLDAACARLGISRHKLRRAFDRAGMASPSSYLTHEPPGFLDEPLPVVREPEPVREPERAPPAFIPVKPKQKPVKNEVRTYVVVSDVHVPYHSQQCTDAVAEFMADVRPHGIVIAGDFLDLLELSRHSAQSLLKLEGKRVSTTFAEANALLDQWQHAAGPQCEDNHFIDGNHEDRIARWLAAGDNGVWAGDDSVSIEGRLKLRARGFTYHAGYPSAGVMIGKLWITHGRFCNKFHASKHLDFYRHSIMYGHTHQPMVHYASSLNGQQVAIGLGHLADPDSEAMSYAARPNAWCNGFAVVHVRPDGAFNAQPINFWDGQFAVAGKVYGRAPVMARAVAR